MSETDKVFDEMREEKFNHGICSKEEIRKIVREEIRSALIDGGLAHPVNLKDRRGTT